MPEAQAMPVESRWRRDYSMARLCSWRVGGAARWLFSPSAVADWRELRRVESPSPPLFVGHGSNLLVRDGGYDGVVVRAAPGLADLRLESDGRVYAGAGVGCPKLARFCAARGMLGGEFFAGIPGTVGGALAMNAGCHGGETWHWVDAVLVVAADGEAVVRRRGDFTVSYRRVEASEDLFFAAAWFRFDPGAAAAGREKIRRLLRERAETQPLGAASAGSVFCNPPGDRAGRLIERCGLKGVAVGGASVSEKHANFIVNRGDATAADIENLILLTQRRVAAAAGVTLRPEVRIVGRGRA